MNFIVFCGALIFLYKKKQQNMIKRSCCFCYFRSRIPGGCLPAFARLVAIDCSKIYVQKKRIEIIFSTSCVHVYRILIVLFIFYVVFFFHKSTSKWIHQVYQLLLFLLQRVDIILNAWIYLCECHVLYANQKWATLIFS